MCKIRLKCDTNGESVGNKDGAMEGSHSRLDDFVNKNLKILYRWCDRGCIGRDNSGFLAWC